MSSIILPRDVVFAAGGDVWAKYGTLVKRNWPADRHGEDFKEIFSRAGGATAIANISPGVLGVVNAGANVSRVHYMKDPSSGAVLPTWLVDTLGATNSLLQSQAWATAPWTNTVVTPTNNFALSPDGINVTATKLIPNNTGANNNPFMAQAATVTSAEFLAGSCFLKPQGAYAAAVVRVADGGSTNGFQIAVDLNAQSVGTLHGAFGTGVLTGFSVLPLGNGWTWIGLWGSVGAVTSASLFAYIYDTIAHANAQTAYTADGSSGLLGWGAQLERNGTTWSRPPTAYVATGATTAARNAETASVAWGPAPFDMTIYASGYDVTGQVASGANSGLLQFGDTGFTPPRGYLNRSANTWNFSMTNDSGVGRSGNVANTTVYGDFYEVVCQYGSQGFNIYEARNGAAFGAPGATGGMSMGRKWNLQTISFTPTFGGIYAHRAIKVAAGFFDPVSMQGAPI